MWLYRFIDPNTRGLVPHLSEFIKRYHDLTGLCLEQTYLPQEQRIGFIQRFFKFIFYLAVLLAFVYIVPKYGDDIYYTDMCQRRNKCHQYCAIDYYPSTACEIFDTELTYQGNTYTRMFIYTKSPIAVVQNNYNECKNYALDNKNIRKSRVEDRQARIHSCFPYCKASSSNNEDCADEALICDSSDDDCEYVIPMGEIVISKKEPKENSIAFSPLIGIFAMLITMPIQLAFEVYCVIISKMKISDTDSCWVTIRTIVMQFATVAAVGIIICYDAYCLITVHSV